MSWEDYKAKRVGKTITNSTNSTNSTKTVNTTSSSWDEYKKKREEEREKTNSDNKQEDKRKWFQSGEFSDGYQFGDLTKTILSTGADAGQDLGKGILGIGEGVIDTGAYLIGLNAKSASDTLSKIQNSDIFSEEQKNKLRQSKIGEMTAKANDISSNMKEFMKRDLVEESQIANIGANTGLFGGLLNIINGEPEKITDIESMKNVDSIERGSVLGDKSDALVQSAGQLVGTVGLQAVGVPWWVTTGTTSFGGGTEEAFQNDATYGEAGTYGLINAGADILTEKLSGGISFGGKTLDDTVLKPLTNKISNKTLKILTEFGIDAIGEGNEEVIASVMQKIGKKLTYEDEKTWGEILASEEAMDEYLESYIGGMVLGGGANVGKVATSMQITNESIQDNTRQSSQVLQQQNTAPIENTIQQNNMDTNIENTQGIKSEINEILNNKELPMQGYQYEISNNTKINNLRQDANKYFNNSKEAKNYVSMLEKIIADKNVEIRLDANLKTADGRIANGSYSNGVITINPNSTKTGEFIAIHELTHAIGTKSMMNIVENYRKSNAEFNSAVESLLQNYNTTELTEEALSDVSAQLFGNQEFINNIANTNPGFFKKMYNEIKYLWHQFRGYKNQSQFIEDLYYKWTQAYNSNNKLNGTNNYSIAGINAVDNIKNNTDLYNQAMSNYKLALNMAKQGKNNAEIIEKTGWFKDEKGHWKFEFSDKHMSLKNMKYEVGKIYKLGNMLNHNELFMFYPKLANHKVEFVEEKNSKKKAKYDSESETISINSQLLSKKNAQELIEGTLIHEIQHAIQHIEGFEEGASSFSKLAYYNSLGEIEADNTKTRFIDEKYKNKNISNIAPESSKDNPKHRGLDNYLKNKTMLDKIKDGIYNYIKSNKGEYDYEINQEITSQDKEENNSKMDVGRRINKQENSNKSSFSIVPFNSNQIKNVDNSNPTEKTDIRYSISEEAELSDEAKKQLHRYIYMDTKQLNKAFSEAVDNKENMLMEYNTLQKEYKEFQNTEEFKNALNDFVSSESPKQETREIMNKADKYAQKLRYYNNAYEEYKAKQDAINSLLMGNTTDTRSTQQIVKEAEKHFGITNNFKETAYIDINGNQIDFSGKHEGGPAGARTLDHRQINEIDIDMDSFIDMGNIRILPEGGGINLKIEPNTKQYNKLREYIDSVDGEIYIDIDKTKSTYDSVEYKKGTPTNKILSDLQYYFRNGKFPTKSEFADFRYSQNNKSWQQHLDKNFKTTGTRTNMKDIGINVAPTAKNNVAPSMGNVEYKQKKTMNPTEISNLKLEDAITTPKLPQRNYKAGNKQSSFLSNIITDSKFLNEDLRQQMGKEDNIRYYEGITNEKTLEKAYNKLQEDGQAEVIKWHSKDRKNATAEDVAEGWILLKQYQDNGDYQSAVEVAKKMRDIGTTAGQTVQAYNILSRLTPEGMFYYAQSELNEAYNKMAEGKSKKWIEENQSKFDLTPEETQNILDIMKDVATMEDGYDKKVKIAEVQKIITNKIPATDGQSIKAWMRISMLFNPKTQVRNVMGNAVIAPVNMFSDSVSSGIDRLIAKRTGIRTTGTTNLKNYGKGFGKGLYESYNDFRKGINTKNIQGNRFEVSEGKNFNDKGLGKALNRVDNLLSFMLDAGDRGFYEATFTNSINNQMVLNNVTTPTQEMIDIATNEALQRTWQDNNKYTQSVLKIRNILNNVNVKGYGLGDVIIPFAKTPANLTKAIVDYSPAGLVKTLTMDARKFKNSLQNGQYSPQLQHQFVQNLGKATAGTFLYVLSYGLAKAGIATGEADEDKDVKNFMKNSLGISSYSIKIGDKSFSYDWAQPIATPLAIMTNYVKYSEENPDANLIEKAINAMNIGTEQLLQQSFMESLNTVLNGNGTTLENLSQAVLELPARAIPTFSKQIADMVDDTQRTAFEYDKPVQSAINSVVAKIPFASRTLPASVDTLGNEIKKYGGDNNVWNVMFNPANTNKGTLSKAGQEIYNIYKETGDTTIFPRTAPYYINSKGEKITMTSEQRSKFQTVSGKYVESSLNALLNDKDYKKLSNEEKANVINEIVSDSYSKAKYDVLKIDSEEYEKLRTTLQDVKPSTYYNYKFKTEDLKKDNEKISVLINSNYTNKEKTALYETYILSSSDKQYSIIKESFTDSGLNIQKYLEYKNQEFSADKEDDGTVDGKTVSGSKKTKVWNYIENMNITYMQKLLLYGLEYTPSDSQQKQIINYVKSLPNKTNEEKLEILSQFKGFTIYKDGTVEY